MKLPTIKAFSAMTGLLGLAVCFADSVGLTLTDSDTNVDWDVAAWTPQAPSGVARDDITIGADGGVVNAGVNLSSSAIGNVLNVNNGVTLDISGMLNLTGAVNLNGASKLVVDGGSLVLDDGEASTNVSMNINNGSVSLINGAVFSIDGRIMNNNADGSFYANGATITGSVEDFRNMTIANSTFNANTQGDVFRMYNTGNKLTLDNTVVNGRKSDDSGWSMIFFLVGREATVTMENGSVVKSSNYDFENPTSPGSISGATNDIGWWNLHDPSHVIKIEVLSGSKYSEGTIRLGREASGTSSTDGKFEFVVRGDYDSGTSTTRTSEIAAYNFNVANDALAVADSKLQYDVRFEGYTNSVFQYLNLSPNTGMRSGSISFVTSGEDNSIHVGMDFNMNAYAGTEGSTFTNTAQIKGGTTFLVDGSTFLGTSAGTAGTVSLEISGNNGDLNFGNLNLRTSSAVNSEQKVSFRVTDANAIKAANSNGDSRNIYQGDVAGAQSGYTEVIMNSSSGAGGATIDGSRWYMGNATASGGTNYAEIKGTEGALNRIGFYAIEMRNSTLASSSQLNSFVVEGYTEFGANTTMSDDSFRPQVGINESSSGTSEFIIRGVGNVVNMWQMVAGNEASTGGVARIRIEGRENSGAARSNLIIRGGVGSSRDNIVGGVLELVAGADGLPGIDSDRTYFTGVLVLDFSAYVVSDPGQLIQTFNVLRSGMGWNGNADSTLIDALFADSLTDNNAMVKVITANSTDTWELKQGEDNWLVIEYTGTYIPEPSTYACLLGVLALAFAAYRRRR